MDALRLARRDTTRSLCAALVLGCLLMPASPRAAEMVTEVVPVGFRSTDELVAILRPLIPAPGSIGGFQNQLVIKTSAANMAELRRVLASLDKAPANLWISVRRDANAEVQRDLASANLALDSSRLSGRIGATTTPRGGRGSGASAAAQSGALSAGANVQQRSISTRESGTQRLRVLEGKEAFIHSGEAVPVGERRVIVNGAGVSVSDGVRYEEFGTGFSVLARLNGEQVTLQVYPNRRERQNDGNAAVERSSTTVSGTLGRWMEIGGIDSQHTRSSGAIGSSRTTSTSRRQSTYIKVDRAAN